MKLRMLTAPAMPVLAAADAWAQNLAFLREAPIMYVSEEDLVPFRQPPDGALDDLGDGDARSWSNPATGIGADLRMVSTAHVDDAKCRRIEILNRAKGRTGRGFYQLCRQPDDSWKAAAQ